jgi:ligand-binding SRPBCC domain-containing protein
MAGRTSRPPRAIHVLEREQLVAAPLARVFQFFAQARNLEAITPPWLSFSVLTPEPIDMCAGTLIEYRLRLHGVGLRWVSRIDEWEPGSMFVDRQVRGPYRLWHHRHEFESREDGTLVRDTVHYALPLGPLGMLAHAAFVRHDLARVFDYRRERVQQLLTAGAVTA